LGDDLPYLFVAEWRTEDIDADLGCYEPQPGTSAARRRRRSTFWKKHSKPLGVNVAMKRILSGP
jgi:hypothetical protein